ncbi:MAG: NTP transferase domain-containing protein [Hyphomonadaceae bacterium]|nr:NTP transferase domain-containing protein [Hyphomonadaceae bacterium]
MTLRIIPAIMSGGAGTRLWPLSTEDHPKQFHGLMGPRTMFAETVARVSGAVFAPPIVLCGEKHVSHVRSAFEEANTEPGAIVVEPAARNTAAVAAVAAALAREIDAGALVLLIPSDHVIANVAAFHDAVQSAAEYARERIVTFGIAPNHAATGYGYIKRGAALGHGIFAVQAFKEKPDAETAEHYLADGGFSWNSGMFLFAPDVLLAEFSANAEIRDHALASLRDAERNNEIRLSAEYAAAPNLPLDIAVMEHTTRAAVAPCEIGWADVGSWAEVWRLAPRDADDFAVLGSAAGADVANMIASGVRAVAIEGEDLVVVACAQGLLIAPRTLVRDRDALRRAARDIN